MAYIDSFLIPVPTAHRCQFIAHAQRTGEMLIELGAVRIVECWEDDLPDGENTDFRRAVRATPDEAVAFSWVEWPDKATRDAAMVRVRDHSNSDPRMDPAQNPIPFDGKRMIFGGFMPVVTLERQARDGY